MKLRVMLNLVRSVEKTNKRNRFAVKFMAWDLFREAMLNRKENQSIWDMLTQMDCLIGGVDISISYM